MNPEEFVTDAMSYTQPYAQPFDLDALRAAYEEQGLIFDPASIGPDQVLQTVGGQVFPEDAQTVATQVFPDAIPESELLQPPDEIPPALYDAVETAIATAGSTDPLSLPQLPDAPSYASSAPAPAPAVEPASRKWLWIGLAVFGGAIVLYLATRRRKRAKRKAGR
jgi:hypothetical protein